MAPPAAHLMARKKIGSRDPNPDAWPSLRDPPPHRASSQYESTGVTVSDATNGKCQYDFSSSGVDTAGLYYGYFTVTDAGESDHFPVASRELTILIQADA